MLSLFKNKILVNLKTGMFDFDKCESLVQEKNRQATGKLFSSNNIFSHSGIVRKFVPLLSSKFYIGM